MLNFIKNKVWLYFVFYPLRSLHVRALSRELNISPAYVSILSKPLLRKKLLKKEIQGKNLILSTDDYIQTKKWTNIFLLIDTLKLNSDNIILFGSFSRGEDTEKSDIDLAIDGNLPEKYEPKLKRTIQYHNIKTLRGVVLDNVRQGILIKGMMP